MNKYKYLFKVNLLLMKLFSFIVFFIRFPILILNRKDFIKNVNLNKLKKSNKCYILGLGPSLNGIDLSKIDGDTIATNRFVKHGSEIDRFEPTFYTMIDSDFYDKSIQDLYLAIESFKNTAFILNGLYKKKIDTNILKSNNNYLIYSWKGFLDHRKKPKLTKVTPFFNNVVLCAIYIALSLEYDEIYLLGCDFNSYCSITENHCYTDDKQEKKISLSMELFHYSFASYAHSIMNLISKNLGIKIYNATTKSLIDAYERVDIIELNKKEI